MPVLRRFSIGVGAEDYCWSLRQGYACQVIIAFSGLWISQVVQIDSQGRSYLV